MLHADPRELAEKVRTEVTPHGAGMSRWGGRLAMVSVNARFRACSPASFAQLHLGNTMEEQEAGC